MKVLCFSATNVMLALILILGAIETAQAEVQVSSTFGSIYVHNELNISEQGYSPGWHEVNTNTGSTAFGRFDPDSSDGTRELLKVVVYITGTGSSQSSWNLTATDDQETLYGGGYYQYEASIHLSNSELDITESDSMDTVSKNFETYQPQFSDSGTITGANIDSTHTYLPSDDEFEEFIGHGTIQMDAEFKLESNGGVSFAPGSVSGGMDGEFVGLVTVDYFYEFHPYQ